MPSSCCWFRDDPTAAQKKNEYHSSTFYESDYDYKEPDVPHVVVEPPEGYETQYLRLEDELVHKSCCAFCKTAFSASAVGTLACSFHPMLWYAAGDRLTPYSRIETIGACPVCAKYHVKIDFREPLLESELSRSLDCTRIDHTVDPNDLFEHLLIGMPTFLAARLAIYYLTAGEPSMRSNVLLVDKAEYLEMSVAYYVPGQGEYRRPVKELYDEVADQYGLCELEEALHEANKTVKQTISFSEKNGMATKGAEKLRTLYSDNHTSMEFVPFYLIARIEQTKGAMRFVE